MQWSNSKPARQAFIALPVRVEIAYHANSFDGGSCNKVDAQTTGTCRECENAQEKLARSCSYGAVLKLELKLS